LKLGILWYNKSVKGGYNGFYNQCFWKQ
jgi:hypothetical protein